MTSQHGSPDDELLATLRARKELTAEDETYLVEQFLQRVDGHIDDRIATILAGVPPEQRARLAASLEVAVPERESLPKERRRMSTVQRSVVAGASFVVLALVTFVLWLIAFPPSAMGPGPRRLLVWPAAFLVCAFILLVVVPLAARFRRRRRAKRRTRVIAG
ncbi:MAG: hypothetical protein ACRDFX_04885 [Chloroflexota bacterium]